MVDSQNEINLLITAGRAEFIANQSNAYDIVIKPYLMIIQKLAEETAKLAEENDKLKKIPKNRKEKRAQTKKSKKK